jgi:hypothetical protein
LSWIGAKVLDPHVNDSAQAFRDAFGAGTPAKSDDAARALLAQRRSVLDFVRGEVQSLAGTLGAAQRPALELHLEALRGLETRLSPGAGAGACSTEALAGRVSKPVPGDSSGERLRAHGELQMDLLATALACGVRRVGTLLWQPASAGINPFGSPNHHNVTHFQGSSPVEVWKRIDSFYAERFAYLIDRLAALGVLDHTVVAWVSEISQAHSPNNMTVVLAGGAALGLAQGETINLPFSGADGEGHPRDQSAGSYAVTGRDRKNTGLADLWVTVQHACGLRSDTFGDPALCKGPIAPLLRR